MSRIDFYVLPGNIGVDRFVCSIAAKAWSQGNRVHIHTASEQAAMMLDEKLWTFRDISFVPHELYDGRENKVTPVTIGHDRHFPESAKVLINLDKVVPEDIAKFERIVEIAGGDEDDKRHARQRYRYYRDRDYEIHNHKIDIPPVGW